MPPSDDKDPIDSATPLSEQIEAVEGFAEVAARLMIIRELKWAAVEADYRLLEVNSAMRRQLESIRAATLLGRQDLGHLAAAFIRASLEDVMYLVFFLRLDLEDSQRRSKLLDNWDALRSLLAQREYVGDEVMAQLWYLDAFLDAAVEAREKVKVKLRALQKRHRWSGGLVLSGTG